MPVCALSPIPSWSLPPAPAGFVPVAEVGDDGIALSWSRDPDALDGMDDANHRWEPEIPWPFDEDGEEMIPYGVAIGALERLGFAIVEY